MTICDAYNGAQICTLAAKAGPVHSLALNPVTGALASGHHNGTVNVWDFERGRAEDGKPPISFRAHTDAVFGLTYSRNGELLATAGGRDPEHNVGIWDAGTGKAFWSVFLPSATVRSVAFSPDAGRLVCTPGHWLSLLDVQAGQELPKTPPGDRIIQVVFSPDGQWLATAGAGQTVWLWDAAERKQTVRLPVSGGEVWGVAFSPDGRYLATCSGYKGKGTIQIWDRKLWDVRSP